MVDAVDLVDVDKIWTGLGRFGKYQVRQTAIFLVAIWSCGFHMLSIVFMGYRPSFECKELPGNISKDTYSIISTEYLKCNIKTTTNISGVVSFTEEGCSNGWIYQDGGETFAKERSIISDWDLVCDKAELPEISQTLIMLGQGLGAFIFSSLADRRGRKLVNIGCHIGLFAVTMATAFMPIYSGFAAMRFLTGFLQQGTGVTLAILNLELYPKEIRGNMEVLGLVFWSTGIALITPIAYIFRNMSWRYMQIFLSCLSSWSLIQWFLVDESLRWLIANGKVDRAKAQLKKACRVNKKDYTEIATMSGFRAFELAFSKEQEAKKELLEIEKQNNRVNDYAESKDDRTIPSNPDTSLLNTVKGSVKRYSMLDLLRSKRLLFASFIMWFAWITNSATYYGIMLISSSLAGNRFLNFFLGSVVEYPSALMEAAMINRYGRKPTVILFHCIAGVSLMVATILTTTADGNKGLLIGSTVFTLIGKFGITGSFSTLFLYTQEIYPTNLRNAGLGLSSAAGRIGGMVAPFARNLAEVAIWAPGLIFGIMCFIVAFTFLFVPETKTYELPQTIEECEEWYKNNQFKLPCCNRRSTARGRNDRTIIVNNGGT